MKQQNKNLQMNEQKAIENEKKTTKKIIIWNVIFCKSVKKEEKVPLIGGKMKNSEIFRFSSFLI